jgi:type II secretory pathway component PulM
MLAVGGTFVSAILRLAVTVGILVAVYFLIVRPVLDTTESITHDISHSMNAGLHSANRAIKQADITSPKVQRRVRTKVRTAIKTSGNVDASNLPADAQKLLRCVERAGADVDKLQACQ